MNTLIHYIKVAFRNLARHKTFALINIIGLAFGMLVCLALIMLITNHMMFDRYNTKYERIYRICRNDGPNTNYRATTPLPIRNELLEKYTGIEKAVRFKHGFGNDMGNPLMERADIPIAGLFADPEVFEVFEYDLEYGDPKTALVEPYSVVLKKSAARKLFKQENPVGETLSVGEIGNYKVTGILSETDNQSHIEFEALASMATVKSLEAERKSLNPSGLEDNGDLENWEAGNNGWVYVLLNDNGSPKEIQTHLNDISQNHYTANVHQLKWSFSLQKLSEITPGIPRANEIGPVMPWIFVYFLATIGLSILATSCFNFTTLSIARSLSRAKEIGVRKVTGASRSQIFTQFTLESVIISLLALGIAIITMLLIRPYFLSLNLVRFGQINLTANFYICIMFFLFAIIVGIMAGLFPAAILSAFKPVNVLKSLSNLKVLSKIGLRRSLIISQFSIALIFIITTIVVYSQLNLFVHVDHGFEMNDNVVVELNKTSSETIKTELAKYRNIESISAASHAPATFIRYWGKFKKAQEAEWNEIVYFAVDEDYIRNLNLSLLAGHFFSSESKSLSRSSVVINEEAVKLFHYASPMSAIGEVIVDQRDSSRLEIIGVVKNYNSTQVTQGIQPMVLIYLPEQFNILQVKYSGTYAEATKSIESAWAKVNPGTKAGYRKLTDEVLKFYNLMFGDLIRILGTIAFFSITICCLGLLGIVFYSMETRVKEISIRKLCGASDRSLIILMSKNFVVLFLISVVIGVPIAYLINNFWLENLANHIVLGIGVFSSGVITLGVLAALTILSQTFRATNIKPVDTLKID